MVLFDARDYLSEYFDRTWSGRSDGGRAIQGVIEEIDSYRMGKGCNPYSDVEPKPMAEEQTALDSARGNLRQASEVVRLQGVLSRVKATLSEVAVYEGMPIGSDESVLLYLAELVRDHEELERRIDLAMMTLADESVPLTQIPNQVANILKGGERTPDDLSEIVGGDQG